MTLLIPLGLLGLLSIIALIVIYIIKPNYQHKEVSSTYVWKLSLKYRKKRLPSSKLRNIFLIACQVLALVAGALIMSQPIIRDEKGVFDTEVVAIIDASASMRTKDGNGVTRFERAVEEVSDLANNTIAGGGYVSVILADGKESYLAQKAGLAARANLNEKLKALVGEDLACGYGTANVENAITMCEDIVRSNPTASVYLYTDTTYSYVPEGINVVNVATEGEWNVGIINAYTEFEEGYYTFFVELGCYGGVARTVDLSVKINDADGNDANGNQSVKNGAVSYSARVTLNDNSTTTVIFRNYKITETDDDFEAKNTYVVPVGSDGKNNTRVFAYDNADISIGEEDGLEIDNRFSLWGGRKPVLKIEYATSKRRTFITGVLAALRKTYAESWEFQIDEIDLTLSNAAPVTTGYDFYIFDDTPAQMPQDGVVFLYNPNTLPVGLTKDKVITYNQEMGMAKEGDHAILKNMDASRVFTRRVTSLTPEYDKSVYKTLWSVDTHPALMINDGENEKVIVTLFDFEWSNIELTVDFPFMMYNIFETFMPATVVGHTFEVGQEIKVNARGNSLELWLEGSDDKKPDEITTLPSNIALEKYGTYRLSHINWFGDKEPDELIFVKIPSAESNVSAIGVTLKPIYREKVDEDNYQDLLVYLAAAMLALLFTEWFLQTQESL